MVTERDLQMAPCLRRGPLAVSGRELVEAARALGRSRTASIFRSWTVPLVYEGMEKILGSDEDPVPRTVALLERLTGHLRGQQQADWSPLQAEAWKPRATSPSLPGRESWIR